MPVPHIFGPLTGNIPLSYLDDNFAAILASANSTTALSPEMYGAPISNPTKTDEQAAVQDCFNAAQAAGVGVYLRRKYYVASPVLFGNQNVVGASACPSALYGDNQNTCGIVAITGCTGIPLQAVGCIRQPFLNFSVDWNNVATVTGAFDAHYGVSGPSAQSIFFNITGTAPGSPTIPVINLNNQNDSNMELVVASSSSPANIGLSAIGGGGVMILKDCISSPGFLDFGCQNGSIIGGYQQGIRFASPGGLNYVAMSGNQVYWNTTAKANLWSKSFGAFQSVHGLVLNGCWLMGAAETDGAFGTSWTSGMIDLNLWGGADFNACNMFAPANTYLFGPHSTRDPNSVTRPVVRFRGGSIESIGAANVQLNCYYNADKPANCVASGFDVDFDDCIDNTSGLAFPSQHTVNWLYSGSAVQQFTSATWYDVTADNALYPGSYMIHWFWNADSGAANRIPYTVVATALVAISSTTTGGGLVGTEIAASCMDYTGAAVQITFRAHCSASTGNARIQFKSSVTLPTTGTGSYSYKIIRLAGTF